MDFFVFPTGKKEIFFLILKDDNGLTELFSIMQDVLHFLVACCPPWEPSKLLAARTLLACAHVQLILE